MLTVLRCGWTCALLAVASASSAQTLSLSRPSMELEHRTSITVVVGGQPRPDPGVFTDVAKWVVIVRSAANPVGTQVPLQSVLPTTVYQDRGLIRITFASPVAADIDAADVIWLPGKSARVAWNQKGVAGVLGVFPVEKRDKADIYLFGSWVSGPDVSPVYNVDLSVAPPPLDIKIRGGDFRVTTSFTMKSAERRSVDPDSYQVSAKMGRLYPVNLGEAGPYLDFQWDAARLEFSRKDSFSNFVTAPSLVFSKALFASLTEQKLVRAAVNVELLGSIEAGANLRAKDLPEGYGTIFRVVPGVAFYAAFPGALGTEEVRWTSTYRARILTTKEPYIDVRDDDEPFASVARGTRHEWKDQLEVKVTPLLSLAVAHEFGSTPPAFKILNHRFTLGVTMMWAWRQ